MSHLEKKPQLQRLIEINPQTGSSDEAETGIEEIVAETQVVVIFNNSPSITENKL